MDSSSSSSLMRSIRAGRAPPTLAQLFLDVEEAHVRGGGQVEARQRETIRHQHVRSSRTRPPPPLRGQWSSWQPWRGDGLLASRPHLPGVGQEPAVTRREAVVGRVHRTEPGSQWRDRPGRVHEGTSSGRGPRSTTQIVRVSQSRSSCRCSGRSCSTLGTPGRRSPDSLSKAWTAVSVSWRTGRPASRNCIPMESLDRDTCQRQVDRMHEERALALMEKHGHELEGPDVEALPNHASSWWRTLPGCGRKPAPSRSGGFKPSWLQPGDLGW